MRHDLVPVAISDFVEEYKGRPGRARCFAPRDTYDTKVRRGRKVLDCPQRGVRLELSP